MRGQVIVSSVLFGMFVIGSATWESQSARGDEWIDGAAARIEKHRMADATVVVVDEQNRPIGNARVDIEQTRHKFLFGCNIFMWGRCDDEQDNKLYRDQFAHVFNFATLPFYWWMYERRAGEPDHERTRQVATWCLEKNILTKGHPLAWNYADPRWLPDDLDEIRRLQMARIDDCVTEFKGLIDCWDVVNEATHFERKEFRNKSPKLTMMWEKAGRIEFTKECFQHARDANPQATLLINDYRVDSQYKAVVEDLVNEQGKPIYDVIGIQSHQHSTSWSNAKIWEVCERYAGFGVPLHFTETTFTSGEPPRRGGGNRSHGPTNEQRERWQADEVERFYTMLFSHPAVEAVTWWDFSDRSAWQGAAAGFLRKDMSPKPAYDRLAGLIKDRWWTKLSEQTDAAGNVGFRGFLGDYRLTIAKSDGQPVVKEVSLSADRDNRIVVRLSD